MAAPYSFRTKDALKNIIYQLKDSSSAQFPGSELNSGCAFKYEQYYPCWNLHQQVAHSQHRGGTASLR